VGTDKLSNKVLGYEIGKYYDRDAAEMVSAVQDIETSFKDDWIPILKTNLVELDFKRFAILSDWTPLIDKGKPRNILLLNNDNYRSSSNKIDIVLLNLGRLIKSIQLELE
jgi:hypothetical protein